MVGDVDALYETELRDLPVGERLRLLELIARDLSRVPSQEERSILQIRGLGAEIWQGIEAQEYVNEMRNEWDQRC